MNELIQVTIQDGQQVVSARALYKGLEIKRRFSAWVADNFDEYEEGTDFTSVRTSTVVNNGARRGLQDYAMTVGMAKEVSMMSKTPLGKQYRQYFLALERRWNDPQEVVKRGYAILQDQNAQLTIENAKLKPKADYFDNQMHNPGLMTTTVIAKRYGKSPQWLNGWLKDHGVIYKQGKSWIVRQHFASEGYADYEQWSDKEAKHVHCLLKWTQKGQKFIYDTLKAEGIYPVTELMTLPAEAIQ
ncbi:hypothetical protein FC26_GL002264 [Paucilactobacillus vaccinostercus DSM 20634]|uniref:Uncharacterized protein n=1 Tax=Paucilactobacillus vaccinostercus DSM 20634 TaxID=1423813 RepID=A0A0R2A2C0_9LACO|nr:phage antirepressor KilAC domain-containing protein [Paucilactobacillus vaccinostercus]KRM61047.1 hypothetical protein FC26_GL002264 [Paucilactobacillus vaccinostercus DSM 20634]